MTTSGLIMISFFLVVITASYGVAGDGNDVVYSDGEPVKPNVLYYISFMEYNMWICKMNAISTNLQECPHQPVMFTRPTIAPTPIMFVLPSSNNDTVIRESTKVSIKFANARTSSLPKKTKKASKCGGSGFWRVANGDVVLNGARGRVDSMFEIHLTDSYYKFTFGNGSVDPYGDIYETSVSLSYDGDKDKLVAKPHTGSMEVLFRQNYPLPPPPPEY